MAKKSFYGEVKNKLDLRKKYTVLKSELLSGQVAAVRDSTLLIHEQAINLIRAVSSGGKQVRYSRSGTKRTVTVSRPGDAPNTDTGRLIQSIKFDFKDNGLRGRVGSNAPHAAPLEFGTRNMEARPWLSTAVRLASKEVAKIFKERVELSFKGIKK